MPLWACHFLQTTTCKLQTYNKNNPGTYNVIEFLRGMNYALKTIQNEKKIKQFEELYEDIIPIHLIESCQFEYKEDKLEFLEPIWADGSTTRIGAKDVGITIVGHIKNENGNFTQSNDYIHKLEKCITSDKYERKQAEDNKLFLHSAGTLTLRVGNDIYENCFLKDLFSEISIQNEKSGGGVYDMKITAKLLYNLYNSAIENNDITTLNPDPFDTGIRGDFGNNNVTNV